MNNKDKSSTEEILFPDVPICDPHHHFFTPPQGNYMLDDLLQDIDGGHHIVQTVYIDCHSGYHATGPEEMKPVGETEFVVDLVSKNEHKSPGTRIAAGIVGFTELTLGEGVVPVLEAHIDAGKGRFRGVRQVLAWDDSPAFSKGYNADRKGLASDSKFRAGFAFLNKYNLSFDALVFHPQLPELGDLAQAFSEITFILNHCGIPLGAGPYAGKQAEVLRNWQRDMASLAECSNVMVKIGGFGMNILNNSKITKSEDTPEYVGLAEIMQPYASWCLEKFGVQRCMFESNFPVDKEAFSYNTIWNAFKYLTKDFSSAERQALFHDTATKAYRL